MGLFLCKMQNYFPWMGEVDKRILEEPDELKRKIMSFKAQGFSNASNAYVNQIYTPSRKLIKPYEINDRDIIPGNPQSIETSKAWEFYQLLLEDYHRAHGLSKLSFD